MKIRSGEVEMSELRQIGEVANGLDINPKTIRYYEEIGLIPSPYW